MHIRQMIVELVRLGPLPSEAQADVEHLKRFQEVVEEVIQDSKHRPLTNEETKALVGLFGADECFGGAWSLLHLIETAPSWPIEECMQNTSNEWVARLKRRVENARRFGGTSSGRSGH
jgi:hypothetical protein